MNKYDCPKVEDFFQSRRRGASSRWESQKSSTKNQAGSLCKNKKKAKESNSCHNPQVATSHSMVLVPRWLVTFNHTLIYLPLRHIASTKGQYCHRPTFLGQLAAQRQLHTSAGSSNHTNNNGHRSRMSDSPPGRTTSAEQSVTVHSDEALAHNLQEQEEMDAEMKEVGYAISISSCLIRVARRTCTRLYAPWSLQKPRETAVSVPISWLCVQIISNRRKTVWIVTQPYD
jgi:hypothetical protein